MGIFLSTFLRQISRLFNSDNSWSIIIVGLANAGKSSLIGILKSEADDDSDTELYTEPTIGHSVETIKYKNVSLHMWDLGGQDKIMKLWPRYYLTAQAVIFMIDSADTERFAEAKEALHSILHSEDLVITAPILILANKQDLVEASPPHDVLDIFDISHITERPIELFPCVVKRREGIEPAMEWLISMLEQTS